jgi:hypothetical protein
MSAVVQVGQKENNVSTEHVFQGSSQGILAYPAGMPEPPRGTASTHETKILKNFKFFFHVLCMYLSSKHAEMHSNTLLLPFY